MIEARRIPRIIVPLPACEVLGVIASGNPSWFEYRSGRVGAWLADRGITHAVTSPADLTGATPEALQATGAQLVIAEGCCVQPDRLAALAAASPEIRFVALSHSSPSWLGSHSAVFDNLVRLSITTPNLFVGVVDDPSTFAWPAGAKVIQLPNLIGIPDDLQNEEPSTKNEGTLCISIVARDSPVKNWAGMIAALGHLASRRPIKGLLIGGTERRAEMGRSLGVEVECHPTGPWEDYLRLVRSQVHVALACGFSDTLNLVAVEHCLMGIPVVGSPSTDWLPASWRINPQNPRAMADLVEAHVANPRAGATGKKIARALGRANEALLLNNLRSLLAA